jgi:hypothetical protein
MTDFIVGPSPEPATCDIGPDAGCGGPFGRRPNGKKRARCQGARAGRLKKDGASSACMPPILQCTNVVQAGPKMEFPKGLQDKGKPGKDIMERGRPDGEGAASSSTFDQYKLRTNVVQAWTCPGPMRQRKPDKDGRAVRRQGTTNTACARLWSKGGQTWKCPKPALCLDFRHSRHGREIRRPERDPDFVAGLPPIQATGVRGPNMKRVPNVERAPNKDPGLGDRSETDTRGAR